MKPSSTGRRADLVAVVVQHGHADETAATLAAMAAGTPRPGRIVVVDAASPDGAADAVAPACASAGAELLRLTDNPGYAGAANRVVRPLLADPAVRWVAYCNNDVLLAPDYFGAVLEILEREGGACASGVLLRRAGGVDWAGGHVVPWRAHVAIDTRDPGPGAPPFRTAFVTGTAMVVSTEALRRVGPLPEAYAPGYCEDAELCWRIARAGGTLWGVPAARGVHGVNVSFGTARARPAVLRLTTRNRLWLIRRNGGLAARAAAQGYFALTKPFRGLLEALQGRPRHAVATWRGWLDGALGRWPAVLGLAALLAGGGAAQGQAPLAPPVDPRRTVETVFGPLEELRRLDALLDRGADTDWLIRRASRGLFAGAPRDSGLVLMPALDWGVNTGIPTGGNMGGTWASRGAFGRLRIGGVAFAARWWRFAFAPEVQRAENRGYAPQKDPWWVPPMSAPFSPWADPRYVSPWLGSRYSIDQPVRRGTTAWRTIRPGQSGIWLTPGPFELGFTTEDEWWGPALRNALVLSSNAPGIPRLSVRSRRPIVGAGGTWQFSAATGATSTSGWFLDSLTDIAPPRGTWTGATVVFAPHAAPGLSVGLARAVYTSNTGWRPITDALSLLGSVGRPASDSGLDTTFANRRDQVTSVFARYVPPGGTTNLYAEVGRREEPATLRDLLVDAEHSLAYTLGLEHLAWRGDVAWRVQAELTETGQSPTWRYRRQGSWYTSNVVRQGYTNDGMVIGSALGPGGSGAWLAVDRLSPRWGLGAYASRARLNADAFHSLPWNLAGSPSSQGWCEFDTPLAWGVRGHAATGAGLVSASLGTERRLSTWFQNRDGCPTTPRKVARDERGWVVRLSFAPGLRWSSATGRRPSPAPPSLLPSVPDMPDVPAAIVATGDRAVGSDLERLARARALLAPNPGQWSLRPFGPAAAEAALGLPAAARAWRVIRPTLGLTFNSDFPFGLNDGAMWAGRGLTTTVMGGVSARVGALSVTLAPVAFRAENAPFATVRAGGAGEFADVQYPGNIDLPQRFGSRPWQRVDWGQSGIRLDAFGLAAGLTSENQWWGPAADFPYLFSNDAAGMPRLFAGMGRPVPIGLGRLMVQAQWGSLAQSPFFDPGTANRRRMGSGLVAVLTPAGLPDLELGGGRFYHASWPSGGIPRRYWMRPFANPFAGGGGKSSDADQQGNDAENQLASLFFRFRPAGTGTEVYGELGREDAAYDLRDVVVAPSYLTSRMMGVAHAWLSGGALHAVRGEWMSYRAASDDRNRAVAAVYLSGASVQGHTLLGQMLGAPLGAGSSAGAAATYDRHAPDGRWSFAALRLVRRDRTVPGSAGDPKGPDVQYALSAERTTYGRDVRGAGVGIVWNANRDFGRDRTNLRLWLRWTP